MPEDEISSGVALREVEFKLELGTTEAMRAEWPALWVIFSDHLLAIFIDTGRWDAGAAYMAAASVASRNSAQMAGRRLAGKPEISEYIKRALAVLRGRDFGIDVMGYDETRRLLTEAIRTPLSEVFDAVAGTINEDKAHLVEEVTINPLTGAIVKVKMMNKMDAIKTNAKLGGFDPTDQPPSAANLPPSLEEETNPGKQLLECLKSAQFKKAFLALPEIQEALKALPESS